MRSLIGTSINEIQTLLKNKTVSACEILEAHLAQINNAEPKIRAFLCLTDELAWRQAKQIDELIAKGQSLPPLAGVLVALKDILCMPDYPTTCGSKILENFIPSYYATAVKKLFDAGAICVGKTNLDEFAMGSSTENSAYQLTANPWNTNYVPGGTSGGSAAAVCAGASTIALGTDTGGSVRQPASFCGVVGMKPTYGLVSRFDLVAYGSSLDQVGPIARSVEDAAYVLATIAGHDPKDSTSLADPTAGSNHDLFTLSGSLSKNKDCSKLKIGIIKELTGEGIEPEVKGAIIAAGETFTKLGAQVDIISIPTSERAISVYYIVATAEASANLARFDGVRYGLRDKTQNDVLNMYVASRQAGFGPEVKRRIMLGTYVLSSGYYDAYYKKAQQVRRMLLQDFQKVFAKYDLVISPTSPIVAFAFGEKTADPLTMYLADIGSVPANLTGLPAISIPCGFGRNSLPIGLQLMGPPLSDTKLLKAAYAFEQATDFHTKRPTIFKEAIKK